MVSRVTRCDSAEPVREFTELTMLFVLLWIISPVWSQELPPPQDVHVDSSVRWVPAPEHRNATYRVQYLSFDTKRWRDFPTCVRTELTSCDVTHVKAGAEHGCVRLQVRAEEHGLTSKPVEACSKEGDSCSPAVRLTPRPGFLTVKLTRNHSLALVHGDHARHNVCYSKEGESREECLEAISSVDIKPVKEGLTYCVRVQFLYHFKPLGPPSCPQCETIPESSKTTQDTKIAVTVVVLVVIVVLVPVIAYILIFQLKRIKQWMRPYELPVFILQPLPERRHPVAAGSLREERYDRISFVFSEEESHQRA